LGQCWSRVWAVAWVARHSAAVAIRVDSLMVDGYGEWHTLLDERRWLGGKKKCRVINLLGTLPYPAL
jgi:hypothetical protein